MSPIVIIPNSQDEVTIKTEDFKKMVNDAYYSGYNDGFEKGKVEGKSGAFQPTITYRGIGDQPFDNKPYCGGISLTECVNNELQRSQS